MTSVARAVVRRPVRAYLGLGSNLNGPARQLRAALACLRREPGVAVLKESSFYRSPPLGPADQPDYVNAVASIRTTLEPLELLDVLKAIEAARGRVRNTTRWGPRVIDLDILLYGDTRIRTRRLEVPHPHLGERAFVVLPLHEIAPALTIPGCGRLQDLLAAVPRESLSRL